MLTCCFVQAASVYGHNPSVEDPRSTTAATPRFSLSSPNASSPSGADIAFATTVFEEVREGYVALEWNSVAGADVYQVTDATGAVLYRGAFSRAFLSGLSNGEYEYQVAALDATGAVLAQSQTAARVSVKHWPLAQAWALFAVGGLVFLAIIAVLVSGIVESKRGPAIEHPRWSLEEKR